MRLLRRSNTNTSSKYNHSQFRPARHCHGYSTSTNSLPGRPIWSTNLPIFFTPKFAIETQVASESLYLPRSSTMNCHHNLRPTWLPSRKVTVPKQRLSRRSWQGSQSITVLCTFTAIFKIDSKTSISQKSCWRSSTKSSYTPVTSTYSSKQPFALSRTRELTQLTTTLSTQTSLYHSHITTLAQKPSI